MPRESARAHPQRVCRAGLAPQGGQRIGAPHIAHVRVLARSASRVRLPPDDSTAIARTCDVMIHWSPAWNSMWSPRPTQRIFKQLPVRDGRPRVRTYMNDLRRPLMSVWNDAV